MAKVIRGPVGEQPHGPVTLERPVGFDLGHLDAHLPEQVADERTGPRCRQFEEAQTGQGWTGRRAHGRRRKSFGVNVG